MTTTTATEFKNEYLSVSRLKVFEQCPYRFKLQYIDDLEPLEEEKIAAEFGKVLHAAEETVYRWVVEEEYTGRVDARMFLDAYQWAWDKSGLTGIDLYTEGAKILKDYARANPMIDHRRILAVEKEIWLELGEGFQLKGFIDRVDKADDLTIEIRDYKSNRLLFTKDDMLGDIQPYTYAIAAKKLWPWARRFRFFFTMLRHDLEQEVYIEEEQLDAAHDYILMLGKKTEESKEYPARINPFCNYCGYRDRCDKYQDVINGKLPDQLLIAEDFDELLVEREELANKVKILYDHKRKLDTLIKAELKTRDRIETPTRIYKLLTYNEKHYPLERTLAVLREAGVDEVQFKDIEMADKQKVERIRNKLKETMDAKDYRVLKVRLDAVAKLKPGSRLHSGENKKFGKDTDEKEDQHNGKPDTGTSGKAKGSKRSNTSAEKRVHKAGNRSDPGKARRSPRSKAGAKK